MSSIGATSMPQRAKILTSYLTFCADLQDRRVLQHRLQHRQRLGAVHLPLRQRRRSSRSSPPSPRGPAACSTPGPAPRRIRDPHQLAARISFEPGRLGVDRHAAHGADLGRSRPAARRRRARTRRPSRSKGTSAGASGSPAGAAPAGAFSAMAGASTPSRSATRLTMVRNSICRRKSSSASASGSLTSRLVQVVAQRHVAIELHQPLRHADLLGMLDQRLPPLGLLDLLGARQQRLQIAELVDQQRRGLDPDARRAGHVVDAVARPAPARPPPARGRRRTSPRTSSASMRMFFIASSISTPPPTSCIRSLSD